MTHSMTLLREERTLIGRKLEGLLRLVFELGKREIKVFQDLEK